MIWGHLTLTEGLMLSPGQEVSRKEMSQREAPTRSPASSTMTAPTALQRAHIKRTIVPHHCNGKNTAT